MTAKNETFDMDIELAHSLFEYRDGALYWKADVARNVKAGDRVAKNSNAARLRVCYDGKYHTLHRIIFAMNYGYYPEVVDHINLVGCPSCFADLGSAFQKLAQC